jgi:dUTP pyrophosphatase
VKLPVKKFTDTARMPERAHADDAGLDMFVDDLCTSPLWPRETRRVYLGVGVRVPAGHMALIGGRIDERVNTAPPSDRRSN